MAIEDRNLKAGTKLVARYKGTVYHAEVVETKDGIRYRLSEAPFSEFKSLSAAGSAVMGGIACNGWRFWSVEGTEPAPKAAKPKETADFRRIPGGRAWCNGCAKAFKVAPGTRPTACPEGHTPDLAEADPDAKAAADEIAVAEQTDAHEAEKEAATA